ncbi:MAG: pyridoxal phosphate-dependent aminotransferase [Acidobacteria bacterium]|nr:pyridoxal phosphate-dependent aminotransferase [Acidobacteriota bacterium]
MAAKPAIDLSISNPTQAGISLPDPFSIASVENHRYTPQASGALPARTAIAQYYAEEFQSQLSPDRILLTASSSEAYSYCFKLIANPGDTILIPQPSYPLLQFLIEAEGLVAKPYPLHEVLGEWILDREALLHHLTPDTAAIVLVHPNNPTGHFLTEADLAWLREISQNRCWLISDEVFADYRFDGHKANSLATLNAHNAFTLSGLSKICALPQMKLGWIVLPEDPQIRRHMELIADTYLSVSSPIQSAAASWLAARKSFQQPISDRIQQNLSTLGQSLANTPWQLMPIQAGWAVILRGPTHLEEEALVLSLLERGFSVHPGFYYDLPFEPCLVLSLLTPPENLAQGVAAILAS